MKKRPLCVCCFCLFVMIVLAAAVGGENVIADLRPSPLACTASNEDVLQLEGYVYKTEQGKNTQVIYLKQNSIVHEGQSFYEKNIIVYDSTFTTCKIGNKIRLSGAVQLFLDARNPGNFEQKMYYLRQGIQLSLFAKKISIIDDTIAPLQNFLQDRRAQLNKIYVEALGEEGTIISAMLLGDKKGLPEDTKELYQKNGIGHILAISGLHISFLGVAVFKLLRKIRCNYLLSCLCAGIILTLYVMMVGFSTSAFRAWVMFLLHMLAELTGRVYDGKTALTVSALLTACANPLSCMEGGFWLSYGAVAGIMIIVPKLNKVMGVKQGGLGEKIAASVGINLTMLPIVLYTFFEIPLYSVLLNLIIIPLMGVILPVALVGGGIGLGAPVLGDFIVSQLSWILMLYEWLCNMAGNLPAARIVCGQPQMWQLVCYYIILIALMYKSTKKVMFIGVVLMLLCISPLQRVLSQSEMEIVMIDVGQGDSILLRTKSGTTCLIDGGSSDIKSVGKYRIEPFLKSQGIGRLDYVFISHGDADHINGIKEMLERTRFGVTIGKLILPAQQLWDDSLVQLSGLAEKMGTEVLIMKEEDTLTIGGMTISCLYPGDNTKSQSKNAMSMVLSVEYKKFSMLFTGDLEGEGESVVNARIERKYSVLKVGHHGSKNSTKKTFLNKISPLYALISSGIDNSYGHPHEELLERLEMQGCKIHNTADAGAVTLQTNGEELEVEKWIK